MESCFVDVVENSVRVSVSVVFFLRGKLFVEKEIFFVVASRRAEPAEPAAVGGAAPQRGQRRSGALRAEVRAERRARRGLHAERVQRRRRWGRGRGRGRGRGFREFEIGPRQGRLSVFFFDDALRGAHAQRDARVRPFPGYGRVRRFPARVRGRRDARDEVRRARDRAPEGGGQAGRQANAHVALDDSARLHDDILSHGARRALGDVPLAGVQARARLRSARGRDGGLDPRGIEPLDAVPRDVDGAHAHGPAFGARAHADRKVLPGGHGVDIQERALQDQGGDARVNRSHRARRGSPSRPAERDAPRASRSGATDTGRASKSARASECHDPVTTTFTSSRRGQNLRHSSRARTHAGPPGL